MPLADAPPAYAHVWNAPSAANPIIAGYYADPALVTHAGKQFLYATLDPWGSETLGCWESADFKHWTFRELNWPTKTACTSPTSKGSNVWAPSVVKGPDGKFHLFISVGSEVWVGVAEHPLGPWRDANGGQPLIPATWNETYHMIDAEAFIDDDGRAYLYWGSGWNWKNGRCFVVELNRELNAFVGEPRDVTPENGHYFEGPFMVKRGGKYYLTYSDGRTNRDTYCVYYAVGDSPLGPFRETKNEPILKTDRARNVVSPGHHAVFTHEGQPYILYHRHRLPFETDTAYRQLCVDPLQFDESGEIETITPTHRGPAFIQRTRPTIKAVAATASSSVGDFFGASAVLDDNHATRWAAEPSARGAWLRLDLGAVKKISRQEISFEYAWKPYTFTVEASIDGDTWTRVLEHPATTAVQSPFVVNSRLDARYLRVTFPESTAGADISIFGWEIFP
ncbi:family 43 glycosylhydrolase [Oleiharenicola lentus]|uniref:family 43 glycosylhydrolase n=1 Tax=Oleiharenicola lentus TaxID=2508720 RepID=UPI003F66F8FF